MKLTIFDFMIESCIVSALNETKMVLQIQVLRPCFRYENILVFATVALSFVCAKYYPIID